MMVQGRGWRNRYRSGDEWSNTTQIVPGHPESSSSRDQPRLQDQIQDAKKRQEVIGILDVSDTNTMLINENDDGGDNDLYTG